MKKHLYILFVVLVAASFFTSAAFADGDKSVTLLSVDYQKSGIALTFDTTGLTKADLKEASLFADSNWHKMYCKFMDDTTKVRCTVQKSLAGEGGFQAVLAGFSFWGELPQEQNFGLTCTAPETLWYSIDVYEDGEYITSDAIPAWIWDLLESYGLFDELEAEGITLKITGEFCDLDIDI